VSNEGREPAIVIAYVVEQPGAEWIRLHFDDISLAGDVYGGTASTLRLTSVLDGALQTLDARHARQWRNWSAYFNGDAVLVEVLAEPGTGPNRVAVDRAVRGLPSIASQCGPVDDRLPSSDPRSARILPIGCTGWLIDDCQKCFLTAGHCTGGTETVQFNVPPSTPGGTLQHPPPSDQYAVDASSLQSNGGQGTGNDWGYFGCFPNSVTGLTPEEAQGPGFAAVNGLQPPFVPGQSIRITGFGTDQTPPERNQVQQTHTGPWVTFSGTLVQYQTDTTGGNSGSPIIHETTGVPIGIHTHGGCNTSDPVSGQNSGTRLSHPALQAALAEPTGICLAGINPIAMPAILEPGVPATVRIEVAGGAPIGAPLLWSRNDGGAFTAQPMFTLGGGVWEGTLLAAACTDQPEWFLTLSNACGDFESPLGAPSAVHAAPVGVETPSFVDDFEVDTGWSVTNGPGLTSGAWQRGVPAAGNRGDPDVDGDGSGQCFLTQNVAGNSDVDGGTTFLTSPPIDAAGGAVVSWQYWYGTSSSTGAEDSLQVEAATDAAGTNWTLVRDIRDPELAWRADSLVAGVDVPASATLRLRFAATDVGGGHVVEAAIDDVRVARLDCGDLGVPFCFGDGEALACPCGNEGLGDRGCDNAQATGGVRLQATGDPSLANVVLHGIGFPNASAPAAVVIRSPAARATPVGFGDGLRCIQTAGLVRLSSGLAGGGLIDLPIGHGAGPGTFFYQLWYRNIPASFCTPEAFNLSNGLSITWP
jgi:V8-like Glu-specific endopeptidase